MTIGPLSRRRALQFGGLGVASLVAGGAGLAWAGANRQDPQSGETFIEPAVLTSAVGSLNVTLEATLESGVLAGRSATMLRYNGGAPGPTLLVQPGDHLGVDLVNHLDRPTNLHTHGLQISPQGNSDNPSVMVNPGETFHYEYQIPVDHPAGTFWYHPHHHGLVADQVFGGLYGAIIIGDPEPPPVTADRVLIISDITLNAAGAVAPVSAMERMTGREGAIVLVNGQLQPQLSAAPGARERWRIINSCVSRYLHLRLDGQQLQLLGIDLRQGGPAQPVSEVVLAPGNRADLLVTTAAGTSTLRALPYNRGFAMGMGGGMGAQGSASAAGPVIDLAGLTVTGSPQTTLPDVAPQPAARDLRDEQPATRRQLTLAMGMGMGSGAQSFTIDGHAFDPARVDQTVTAGTVEEWTITNTSPMDHPFHLHVWPMQVISMAGQAIAAPTWRNVVNVPARTSTQVRIAFDTYAGRTVYHCHILDHEDNGMMGVINVV